MAEFTGERVIPGQVDRDLWNEHFARYLFASRLCRNKRVLDVACGTGYGSAELAQSAAAVTGIDRAAEAVQYAAAHYGRPHLSFVQASADQLPFRDGAFDLITAFEVIEHLSTWPKLVAEARRLLGPGGQFVVSTPNKKYYAESRQTAGPNPFHEHEFTFDEFRDALAAEFPSVTMYVQNHSATVVVQPVGGRTSAEVRMDAEQLDPETSHFFVAVCAMGPQIGSPTFVYLPTAANVLREREVHIARLEGEIRQKDSWLEQLKSDHDTLVRKFREQQQQLEARNRWAEELNRRLDETSTRVVELQGELEAEQKAAREMAASYEAKVAELDGEVTARTQWALDTEKRLGDELEAKGNELVKCVEYLHKAEAELEARTRWADSLSAERYQLDKKLNGVKASRWYQLGRKLGLGPNLEPKRPS